MSRRFLASLAAQTDPIAVTESTDEVTLSRTIVRERIRLALIFFALTSEFTLTILYINIYTQNVISIASTTNELSLFLLHMVLVGCGLRLGLVLEISPPRISAIKICLAFSLLSYAIAFLVSSLFINQPIEFAVLLLLSITLWIGFGFSLLACVLSTVMYSPFSHRFLSLIIS